MFSRGIGDVYKCKHAVSASHNAVSECVYDSMKINVMYLGVKFAIPNKFSPSMQ